MLSYLGRRVAGMLLVLFLIVTLVFLLLQYSPGSPIDNITGISASEERRAAVAEEYGLNKPVWQQYLLFLRGFVTGDLGSSIYSGVPVTEELGRRLPVTLELGLVTLVIWVSLGFLLGIIAGVRKGGVFDGSMRIGTVIALSVPSFWLGIICLMVFGLWFPGILPTTGWVPFTENPYQNLVHLVLPAFVLGAGSCALIARTLRATLIETLDGDYVRFARARGVDERTVVRSVAVRNAVIPTATVVGIVLGVLFSGAVLVERIFALPGIGAYTVESFGKQDFPAAVGCALIIALVFLISNLIVDLALFALSPRIRARFLSGAVAR